MRHFLISLGVDLRIRDLNVQIEALNEVLDQLDAQIDVNCQEIIKIRIPEAAYAVQKNRIKSNNMWITGAIVSAGGQFFREVASNWFLEEFKDITYQRILGMGARYFAGPKKINFFKIFSRVDLYIFFLNYY